MTFLEVASMVVTKWIVAFLPSVRFRVCTLYIYIYTKILEVNLFAFAYRLFHEDFSSIIGDFCIGTHSFFPALYVF